MDDELTELLTARADDALGDRRLRHPGSDGAADDDGPADGPTDRRPRPSRRIWLLGAAAALVVAVTMGVLIARDDDQVVSTPADTQAPADGVDPDVEAAVATAVDATLATSWVADVDDAVANESVRSLVYQPPGATGGVDGAVVRWTSVRDGSDTPEYTISTERLRLESCVAPADCGGKEWTALPPPGDQFDLNAIVGAVDPTTATRRADGTFEADLRPGFTDSCPGCEVRLTVADGFVRRIELHSRGGVDAPWPEPELTMTMTLRDLGSAPTIRIPDRSEVAGSSARRTPDACTLRVELSPEVRRATPQSPRREDEVLHGLTDLVERDDVTIGEVVAAARGIDDVDEVVPPATGCTFREVSVQVEGPDGVASFVS